jgi:glycosyltransferase involved in cell wall biosynthesis
MVEKYKGRVLCVTSNFPRWSGDSTTPFVLNLSEDLQECGWKVDVLAPHAEGTASSEVMNGVQVNRFKYLWPISLETICYQGGALINLRKNKSNYLKLPFLIGAEWINMLSMLSSCKYDILHSHWILPQGFNGVLTAKIFNVPHIVTVHGGDIFGLQNPLLTNVKKVILKNVDAVTVNSSATKKAVDKVAPNLNSIHKIPMGISICEKAINSEVSAIRKKYKQSNAPLLIFVGRVVDEKGVEELIRAVQIIKKVNSSITALIVGEGQDRRSLEELTQTLGLSNNIHFTGWIDPNLIHSYLSAGDIFIGPSRTEAQGLTFLEAMAAKIPVIATRIGGITDSVKDEQTGLLVDERSPDQIATAVLRLIDDSKLKDDIASNGYLLASGSFSREYSAQSFSSLFQSLIQK